MYNIIDILCIFTGGYLTYAGTVMKSQGRIVQNVVMGKGMTESSIRDKEGFINCLYWKLILVGVVIVLAGIANLINELFIGNSPLITLITTCVFVASLVAYGMFTSRALKKYVRR